MGTSLVIQTSFLGDAVLTTPLFADLARRGPVDAVVTPPAAALLANSPHLRRVITYDKRGAHKGLAHLFALGRSLRTERYDVAYLAQGSWRSAVIAALAGIPRRVGFANAAAAPLYTHRVAPRAGLHHAGRLLALADPASPQPPGLRPSLTPGDRERAAVDGLLGDVAARGEPLIALAPGSLWKTKRWTYFPALARLLRASGAIVIVGAAEDTPLADAIREAVPDAVDATGRLTPLGSAELIRRCAVVVSNDSAPLHLASGVDTATIAVFGPTIPEFGFGPLARHSRSVGLDALPCRPCRDSVPPVECPLGHFRCMLDVTPEMVAEHVHRALAERAAAPV